MAATKRKKSTDTAPGSRKAWIAFVILCAVGALLSLELERLHVKAYEDPETDSYCTVGAGFDCNAVATSDWSVFLGLPVAVWGLAAYLAMGVLALWGLRRPDVPWPLPLAFLLALIAVAGSVGLFAISHFAIGSICLMCVATYLVNAALATCGFLAFRGHVGEALGRLAVNGGPVLAVAAVGALVMTGAGTAFPQYWTIVRGEEGPGGLTTGVDAAGHAWIGAAGDDPSIVEIVEYSDYECPHCDRGHAAVRKLIEERPDRLRLVHRHYPLDQACNPTITKKFHENACRYAAMAWCAQQQGRFWETNDFLYANRGTKLSASQVAGAIGLDEDAFATCMRGSAVATAIDEDLTAGRAAGVRGTPTFVIGGKAYSGGIPPEALPAN